MTDVHAKITHVMLDLQRLLDDALLDEHEAIQNAFNALACALDDELVE
jgi:hypothetical protein